MVISALDQASSLFPAANASIGRLWISSLEATVVKELERCDYPTTFLLTNNLGEGVGSGGASALTELIHELAPKLSVLEWNRSPRVVSNGRRAKSSSPSSKPKFLRNTSNPPWTANRRTKNAGKQNVVQDNVLPYEVLNSLLHLNVSCDNLTLSVPSDLEALSDIAMNMVEIKSNPNLFLDDLFASSFVSFSALARYPEDTSNHDLDSLIPHLRPMPSMPFTICGMAPLTSVRSAAPLNGICPSYGEESMPTKDRLTMERQGRLRPLRTPTVRELVWDTFAPENLFCSVDTYRGRYAKSCVIFRSNTGVTRDDLIRQFYKLEKHGVLNIAQKWIHRSPRRAHAFVCSRAEPGLALSSAFFGNHSAFHCVLDAVAGRSREALHSGAFIQQFYDAGLEKDDILIACEHVTSVSNRYKMLGKLVREKEVNSVWKQHDVKFLWPE